MYLPMYDLCIIYVSMLYLACIYVSCVMYPSVYLSLSVCLSVYLSLFLSFYIYTSGVMEARSVFRIFLSTRPLTCLGVWFSPSDPQEWGRPSEASPSGHQLGRKSADFEQLNTYGAMFLTLLHHISPFLVRFSHTSCIPENLSKLPPIHSSTAWASRNGKEFAGNALGRLKEGIPGVFIRWATRLLGEALLGIQNMILQGVSVKGCKRTLKGQPGWNEYLY